MKQYLVAGHLFFAGRDSMPFTGIAMTEPGEIMDAITLYRTQAILLKEAQASAEEGKQICPTALRIASFQPFETQAVAQPAAEPHLNECSVVLPPVDSPLLIELAPGVLVRATRPSHAQTRDDYLRFDIMNGTDGWYIGRPRWTHP